MAIQQKVRGENLVLEYILFTSWSVYAPGCVNCWKECDSVCQILENIRVITQKIFYDVNGILFWKSNKCLWYSCFNVFNKILKFKILSRWYYFLDMSHFSYLFFSTQISMFIRLCSIRSQHFPSVSFFVQLTLCFLNYHSTTSSFILNCCLIWLILWNFSSFQSCT